MKESAQYTKVVEWSDADQCFIGSCPDLFYGGCHGDDERKVFAELCEIVEEVIALYRQDGKSLPPPTSWEVMTASGKIMSRTIKQIEIENQPAIAIFDTGATYTYCRSSLVSETPRIVVAAPVHVALGGRHIDIQELCLFQGEIEGLPFFTDAVPVDALGEADGYELDALIGARTMEQWEIKLCPKTGTLSLEGLRRREFTEF